MHSTVSTVWRFPEQILFFMGCFHGFPEMPHVITASLMWRIPTFHWLLITPPKPVGIWLSTLSVGVTLHLWKVLSGGVQDDSKLESSN